MSERGAASPPPTVLILTASMGAGHDGVATEVAGRIADRGYAVEVIDLLDVLPGIVGRSLKAGYSAMLRRAPWLYEAIYRVWFAPETGRGGPISPLTVLAERRLKRWLAVHQPVVAVSTFHLCSAVLASLKGQGALRAPAVSIVVDMAVHRLWVDPAIDLHLCIHPDAAEQARARGAPRTSAPGPVVRACFSDPSWDRRSARASLGLTEEERVVLMVAGSWGTGDVERTLEVVSRASGLTPLVVCGADRRLHARLASRSAGAPTPKRGRRPGPRSVPSSQSGSPRPGPPRIMGWVSDMARLMAAADVVLENAGGLTSMEALAMGVPVVSFHPIPGHGRANVAVMARAGLLAWTASPEELVATLVTAASASPLRARLVATGRNAFAGDAADDILGLVPERHRLSDHGPSPAIRPAPNLPLPRAARGPAMPGGETRDRSGPERRPGVRPWRGHASRRKARERRRRQLLSRVPSWAGRRR